MSDGNDGLRSALRTLSSETRNAGAGPQVKSNLLGELQKRRRKALALRWWPAVAVAAMVVGIWLGMPKAGAPPAPLRAEIPTEVIQAPAPLAPIVPEASPAVPVKTVRVATYAASQVAKQLSPLTPWYIHPGIPEARQGHMVYMDVGPETARLFGLATTGPMKAEVFLGDDGLARAIRLVRTTPIARGE